MSRPKDRTRYVVVEPEWCVRHEDGTTGYLPVFDELEAATDAASDEARIHALRRDGSGVWHFAAIDPREL